MSSRRSVTCSVPCRRCRDTAGQRRSNTPPTKCSNAASTWTRPTRHSDETRMAARCGSNRPPHGSRPKRCSPRRSGFSPGRSMPKPTPHHRRRPSTATGLDVLQADAAASVAGDDRLVLVVGPAGAGKTRMLAAAVNDLHAQRRPVFGVAPTAKAARVLERDTGMRADTVAKLLHEWQRPDRPPLPEYRLRQRDDTRRRRGRDGLHPGAASTRHSRRGEPVASRAGRRRSPVASRRPWRPVRRAVRQRPGRRNSNASIASPTTGRLPRRCNCDPVIPAPSTPTKPTTGSSPAHSTITSPRWPTSWIEHHAARRHRRPRRLDQ